jgi:hypothetical protein
MKTIDDTALISAFIAVWTGQTDKVREPGRFLIKRIGDGVVVLPGVTPEIERAANDLNTAA